MGTADRPGEAPDHELLRRINAVLAEVRVELIKSMIKHAPMHSPHEGHSVIREELDELWDHVKADTGRTSGARKEALQVGAMGIRYALDLGNVETDRLSDDKAAHSKDCAIHDDHPGCTCRAYETSPLG